MSKRASKAVEKMLQGLQAGRFSQVSLLGRGGMGAVYRVFDCRSKEPRALKMLFPTYANHPEMRSRFFREVEILERLDHPSLPKIYEVFEDPTPMFTMRLLEARPIPEVLAEGDRNPARICSWVTQAAQALASAHATEVIHRDIKPENLLVDAQDRVHVVDFGVAVDPEGTRITRTGLGVGTPGYMAPEQLRGDDARPQQDLYSLGATAYYLLEGKAPFHPSVLPGDRVLPEAPGCLSPKAAETLLRCLEFDWRKRPASMEEFLSGFSS